jgi:ribosomal protein S18 acetylase RimI-like enzyme
MDNFKTICESQPQPVFSDAAISLAGVSDSEQLLTLVNSSYRGESSRRGWTTEADLIAGEVRISESALKEVLELKGSVVLVYREAETLVGCVNLQHKGDYLYLGMFSVTPEKQNAGIGRKLLQAAEELARQWHLDAIRMSVISVRSELIAWYKRNGYADTGERIPFLEDGMSGKHLQQLEFMILEKKLQQGKKILITGATGMIGGIILDRCLSHPDIREVVSLVRKASGIRHNKLHEIVVSNFSALEDLPEIYRQIDVVFYCQGVYTGAVPPDEFYRITVDYPVAVAGMVHKYSPEARFCLLSGQGADRTETSRMMFARDKGIAENRLSSMGFSSFHSFRPAYIYPVTPRKEPNLMYRVSRIIYPVIRMLGPKLSIRSTALAEAMFLVGLNGHKKEIFENEDILQVS